MSADLLELVVGFTRGSKRNRLIPSAMSEKKAPLQSIVKKNWSCKFSTAVPRNRP